MSIYWNHILHKEPEDGEEIIQVDRPYKGYHTMGQRTYYRHMPLEEYLEWCDDEAIPYPNFYWCPVKDFPFPIFSNNDCNQEEQ